MENKTGLQNTFACPVTVPSGEKDTIIKKGAEEIIGCIKTKGS